MEEGDQAALEASLHYVCENLHSLSQMLGILRAKTVITKALQDVINVEKVEYDKHKALISCLQKIKGAFGPLIQALHDTNQSHLAEYITGKKETTLDGPASSRHSDEVISVSRLKNLYKEHLKSHNPLYLFLDFEFDMEDDYVSLTLHSQSSHEDISDLDVFIEKAFSNFSLAIVIGDPFSGKTTLMQKIAFDWANIGRFPQYDIIWFSEFRLLPDGNYKSILDLALAGVSEIDLSKSINISGKRVLILIDGYDEKRQKHICNQLDKMLNHNEAIALVFDLLITSRPSSVFKRKENVSLWKINGFMSDKQQNDYIGKHFRNLPEYKFGNLNDITYAIKSDLEKSCSLRQLAKSPMMFAFFCLVHENMKQISEPALFDALVKFMIQRFDIKHPERKILHRLADNSIILPAELTDHEATEAVEQWREFSQIRRLGQFAFNATIEKKFVFESNDFGAVNTAAFEGLGLLFKTSLINGVHATHKYQFMHRAIQEFFSALYFLYWQTETVQLMETLLDRNPYVSLNPGHFDFVQMTFDVLMAERNEAALISISPFLSELEYLASAIRLQSQSSDELRKEHAFFQAIMRHFKNVTHFGINGMEAAVDFAWNIKLPHDHHGGKVTVYLSYFNFVGTNELISSVNCSEHVELQFWLEGGKFEPERLRLTLDGHLSHLKYVTLDLTPEMVGKLSVLPDSRFTPSEWSGILSFRFRERIESRDNSNTERLNNASTVHNSTSLFITEEKDCAIHHMLLIFQNITSLYISDFSPQKYHYTNDYSGSELEKFKSSLAQRCEQIQQQTQLVNETITIN